MQTKILDSIEILKTKEIQCRYQLRDTEAFTQTVHYEVFAPGANVSAQSDEIQAICNTVWTPEVVAAYQAEQARIAAEQEAQRLAAEAAQAAAQTSGTPA